MNLELLAGIFVVSKHAVSYLLVVSDPGVAVPSFGLSPQWADFVWYRIH